MKRASSVSRLVRTERIAHLGPAGGAALRDFDPAYVRGGAIFCHQLTSASLPGYAAPRTPPWLRARRLQPVHHQVDDPGTPAGGVPLELDRHEGVARN
jgi:hypothetical protein